MSTSFLKSKCIIVNMPFSKAIQLTVYDIAPVRMYSIVQGLCVRELFTPRVMSTNEQCINVYVQVPSMRTPPSLMMIGLSQLPRQIVQKPSNSNLMTHSLVLWPSTTKWLTLLHWRKNSLQKKTENSLSESLSL